MGKKIRSGVIEKNLKDTLDSTLDAIYDACPLRRSRRSIRDSLCDILYGDETFRKSSPANIMIFGWFEDEKLSSSSSSSSQKRSKSKPFAVFKKTRFHSSAVGQTASITNNYIDNRTARDSSPSVKQSFSFSDSEQGAIIEPFINLSEKTVSDFLANNESTIPLEVVEPFANKQRPPISRDFYGDYEKAFANKENFDNEMTNRKLLEETEKEDRKKMLKLAMEENDYLTKFWRTIKTEERKIQL
ncbi:unnamed protein product [Rhizophagus irregularis]|nr:unnamed protein product [Rhizophagus irregularis]